jgi:hypothetical protein
LDSARTKTALAFSDGRAGAGRRERAASMAAFGRTSFSATVSFPSSHVTVH